MKPRQLPKRSDLVAEEIKSWIAGEGLVPGDRLPQERELIAHFGVSKGTMREALKSLEVQGLVRVSTGPRGGAAVARVSLGRSTQLLANYFFFQDMTIQQVYAVRRLLEPELAASVASTLSPEDLDALEASIDLCGHPASDHAMEHRQRIAELDFHDILANASDNPFLAFNCRFMNSLLKDCTVYRKVYGRGARGKTPAQIRRLAQSGLAAHRALLEAFQRGDSLSARALMHDHIVEAEHQMITLEAVIERRFMDERR